MALTDRKIQSIKPNGKRQKIADSDGLFLYVSPVGAKSWVFRYRFAGKQKDYTIGKYPQIPLSSYVHKELGEIKGARPLKDDLKLALSQGIDIALRKKRNTEKALKQDLKSVCILWAGKRSKEISEKSVQTSLSRLEKYVFPSLGGAYLSDITSEDIYRALVGLESLGKLETIKRTRSVLAQVFEFARKLNICSGNPAKDMVGVFASPKPKHYATTLDPKRFGEMLRAFDSFQCSPELSTQLKLAPLLCVRPLELRSMKWVDIDFEKAQWSFVSSKKNKPLIVPLAKQVIKIIQDIRPLTGDSDFVMPTPRSKKKPFSANAVLTSYRSMGFTGDELTQHGLRATFETLLMENLGYPKHIIELQLSHDQKDPNGGAYDRTSFMSERVKMMQAWADFSEQLKKGGE